MNHVDAVLTALTVAAGLSLVVERTLEFLRHVMDSGSGSLSAAEVKKTSGLGIGQTSEKKNAVPAPGSQQDANALRRPAARVRQSGAGSVTQDVAPAEKFSPPLIPVVPMERLSPHETANAVFLQFAAAGLGIILARIFDLRLIQIMTGSDDVFLLDPLFTGLVIGGGSQPVHLLIRFISKRKIGPSTVTPGETPSVDEIDKTRALAKVVSAAGLVQEKKELHPLKWIDVPYTGGVNPEVVGRDDVRKHTPTTIIYHHTAMSSASSFQDVVDEFLVNKKWITGYHCVIMPDGAIQSLCRWDCFGNHALGRNRGSLGVAFHGNFHTRHGDHYSNADGRFGNQKPTEAQLHAGARVIALWLALYDDIHLDFNQSILSHSDAIPGHTDCPGSNFPHDELRKLVLQYHDAWAHSDEAQSGIAAFRAKQYVNSRSTPWI